MKNNKIIKIEFYKNRDHDPLNSNLWTTSHDKPSFEDYVLNFVDVKYRTDLRHMKHLYIFPMLHKEINTLKWDLQHAVPFVCHNHIHSNWPQHLYRPEESLCPQRLQHWKINFSNYKICQTRFFFKKKEKPYTLWYLIFLSNRFLWKKS